MLRSVQTTIGEVLPPTLTVDEAARLRGISRSTAYVEAARYRNTSGAKGIPSVAFGSRVVVLTVPLLDLLRSREAFRLAAEAPDHDASR